MNATLKRWAKKLLKKEGMKFIPFFETECVIYFACIRNQAAVVIALSGTKNNLTYAGKFSDFANHYSDQKVGTKKIIRGIEKAKAWVEQNI